MSDSITDRLQYPNSLLPENDIHALGPSSTQEQQQSMDMDISVADSLAPDNDIHAPGPSSTQEQQEQSSDILVAESNGTSAQPDQSQIDEQQQASATSAASSEPLLGESTMNLFGDWVNDI